MDNDSLHEMFNDPAMAQELADQMAVMEQVPEGLREELARFDCKMLHPFRAVAANVRRGMSPVEAAEDALHWGRILITPMLERLEQRRREDGLDNS